MTFFSIICKIKKFSKNENKTKYNPQSLAQFQSFQKIIRILNTFGYNFIVVESTARVETSSPRHMRSGDFLLKRLVDEAAVFAVNDSRAEDHRGTNDGSTSTSLGETDNKMGREQEDCYCYQSANHEVVYVTIVLLHS